MTAQVGGYASGISTTPPLSTSIPPPNDAQDGPNPARGDRTPEGPPPDATPAPAATAARGDDENSLTRRDACALVTEGEVGVAKNR